MKKLFSMLIFVMLTVTAYSQTVADSLYIVTYTTGNKWDVSKKPHEQSYFKEHSSNLSTLRKAGTIKFGARYADKGIIIISAASSAAAKELINSDPAVINNLFNADIEKLNVFYDGCVERKK